MAINDINNLSNKKEFYPLVDRPSESKYYLSSEEYNTLITSLQEFIQDYTYNMGILRPQDGIEIIKNKSLATPTDTAVFSAVRTLSEIEGQTVSSDRKYLSKRTTDTAHEKINFIEGIEFGIQDQFDPYYIKGDGVGRLKALELTESLTVPELKYNRVEVNVGDKWRAPGGGIIESATNSSIKLKLEEGELGTIAVGDICMGMFHSMDSSENALLDTDTMINGGKRELKGFATSYFTITGITEQENDSIYTYELRDGYNFRPCKHMHFVSYGNFTNESRQQSVYETRTYQRYLKGINDWTYTSLNVAAQFGDLSNLNKPEINSEGYSIYLNDVFFTGNIQQMKAPIVKYGYWHTWLGVGAEGADPEGWLNTGVLATTPARDGVSVSIVNESLSVADNKLDHTWAEIHVYDGNVELNYTKEIPTKGQYTVNVENTNITHGTLVPVVKDEVTYLKMNPSTDMTKDSASIVFNITGFSSADFPFTIKKAQSLVKVESGIDGKDFEYIYKRTKTKETPESPDSVDQDQYKPAGWELDPVNINETFKYEWVSKRASRNGKWGLFSTPSLWASYASNGIDGKDGTDIEFIFRRNNSAVAPGKPINNADLDEGKFDQPDWTGDPIGVDPSNMYEWVCKRKKNTTTGKWENYSPPSLWAKFGKDGIAGPPGTGVPIVYRGPYKSFDKKGVAVYYTGNSTRSDVVKEGMRYYRAREDAGSFHGVTPPNTAFWYDWGTNFESVATGILLAENANIAGFIFHNNQLISQEGTIAGIPAKYGDVGVFEPNLILDGVTGKIVSNNSTVRGIIEAINGNIGGFNIDDGNLYSSEVAIEDKENASLILNGNTGEITSKKLIAVGGNIGGFSISKYSLAGYGEEQPTIPKIQIRSGSNTGLNLEASIGNVSSSKTEDTGNFISALFENNLPGDLGRNVACILRSSKGFTNTALYIEAKEDSMGGNGIAIDIRKGAVAGLVFETLSTKLSTNLKHSDVYVSCTNTENIMLTLPNSPQKGKFYFIHQKGYPITLKAYGTGKDIWRKENSVNQMTIDEIGITHFLIFDGTHWVFSYMAK